MKNTTKLNLVISKPPRYFQFNIRIVQEADNMKAAWVKAQSKMIRNYAQHGFIVTMPDNSKEIT